ncbi:hypothetical protein [Vibrio owensii]|uniref:hypothetical protein n=1 Tax=Vibrio harveyi group TaxID=717610 RepID=UPI003CC54774
MHYKMNFRLVPSSEFTENELTAKYIDVIHGTLVNPVTHEMIGEVEAIRVNVKEALKDGGPQLLGYVFDSHYEVTTIADVLSKNSTFDMLEGGKGWTLKDEAFSLMHSENKSDEVNVTYIRENRVLPDFMGQGLGKLLLKGVSEYAGKDDGLVLLESLPLQLCDNVESAYDYKIAVSETADKSKEKLKAFYEKCTFQKLVDERHDWMFASTKNLNDLQTRVKVKVNTVDEGIEEKSSFRISENEVSYGW